MSEWIDITQPFRNAMGTWPGDTPFAFELTYTKAQTGSVNIGKFTTSTHTGTHADAPFHFDDDGPTIEQLDINVFIGEALVIDATDVQEITPKWLQSINFFGVHRILLKMTKVVNVDDFPHEITVLSPQLGPFLKKRGVVLVGVDCPSVDALDNKEVEAHHALYENGVHIIENLMLQDISSGLYDFIGLPLKIEGGDGAPVRAVLRRK
ncbi:arylformamidase [Solibacillus sp. FSL H8-0538]|uniref:arylformamidase n=1 Tax=Solibacillus sp. FSL H8-0538 TaxID=2921400 RepID=UPI0030F504AA